MTEIEDELTLTGIPFNNEGNHIRCFPHVVNIAVKTGLKELSDLLAYQPDIYWTALWNDPVTQARSLVTACRASGQRREAFEATVREANKAGGFGDPPEVLRVVGLLKDVDTRWSATFLMIDRILEQYLVLQDIRRFLQVPHIVQEIVSAEKTLTLSIVLPMCEKLILMLKDLRNKLDELSLGINTTIRKLEEYCNMSRRTRVYGLAMGEWPVRLHLVFNSTSF
ncbi:hypothetical protein B0H14DRAFT_3089486 [Mycena olivaceomarginata]|nr:hypothetical protein B0H14DRAFT_3089486 [Mycena olivaceomarginata]